MRATGHIALLSGQVHPNTYPRAVSCFLFSPHGSSVISLQTICNSRNTETGTGNNVSHILHLAGYLTFFSVLL